MIIKRGVNDIVTYFVQDLPIYKNAIQVYCNKTLIIVLMHQYSYFGKGRTTHPNLKIAVQIYDVSIEYLPVSDDICLSRNREHIFCVLHLEEYCSKFPWILQSHMPLKGELFQGELTMMWRQELPQVELTQGKLSPILVRLVLILPLKTINFLVLWLWASPVGAPLKP